MPSASYRIGMSQFSRPLVMRVRKLAKNRPLASSPLSDRAEDLGFQWKYFHKIWYEWIFLQTVMKIRDSLKLNCVIYGMWAG
jgi:hypothetical protein